MVYKGMLKINGIWVPTPTTFDFSTEDLEDEAFRTADGLMHRQRVGKKIKLACAWQVIPESDEYYSLVSLLDGLPEFFPSTVSASERQQQLRYHRVSRQPVIHIYAQLL